MKNIVLALVGLAALIYIGQFAWSFKTAADQRAAAEQAEVQRIINETLERGRKQP